MIKKLFLFSLLLISVLSCTNNALKPKDFSEDEINKKYPYWQVGVSRFEIASSEKTYTTITVEEKRFILLCMAYMRLVVNTEEFVEEIYKNKDQLRSSVTDQFAASAYKIKQDELYDPDQLIEIIRTLKYDFLYRKSNSNPAGASGAVGDIRYVRYGYTTVKTGDFVQFVNKNWISWSTWPGGNTIGGFASTAALLFHEHMHNIGFQHVGNNKVPYVLQDIVQNILNRILAGDLKDKYATQLDELTAYYYTAYKDLLTEDSVFDPNLK